MKLEVRGQTFDITFVNNWVREKYQELLEMVEDLTELPQEVEAIEEDTEASKSEKLKRLKEIRKERKELVKKIAMLRYDILEEILKTNEHEYDKHFWMHKTDVNDVNEFVLSCLQKDLSDQQKKSKKK